MRANSKITLKGDFKIYSGHNIWINQASGSLAIRNVPPHTLAAGVPAIVKKKEIEWS